MPLNVQEILDAVIVPVIPGDPAPTAGVFADRQLVPDALLVRSNIGPLIPPAEYQPATARLEGQYIFGGYVIGHYGHFVLESCARLWFARDNPGIPIVWLSGTSLPTPSREIFEIIGVRNRHLFLSEPTVLERLFVPEVGFFMRTRCAPEFVEFMGCIEAPIVPGKRTWISRAGLGGGQSHILAEGRLEARLSDAGWTIYRPEAHPIRHQAEQYASSEHLAGFAGSGFHTLMFVREYQGAVTIFERGERINQNYVTIGDAKGLKQTVIEVPLVKAYGKATQTSFSLAGPGPILDALGIPRRPVPTPKPPNHTARRVAALIGNVPDSSYLEIGAAAGDTFFSIPAERRVAVDRELRFDPRDRHSPGDRFFEVPSDEYFSYHAEDSRFDLVYIDGLHTFEQAYRDFCNALQVLAPGGAILLDDTMPSDRHSMIANQRQAIQSRKDAGGQGTAWHGDVFKVVFAIHDFHPMLSYATFESGGNPQTLVWREPRRGFKPRFNSLEAISGLTWEDLQANREILQMTPEAEILRTRRLART